MGFDFDTVYDRTGTENSKWSHYPPDVLPMYVADMDLRSPDAIINALRTRVDHGFFGYGREEPEWFEVITGRLMRRYGWKVEPEAIIGLPGVIAGFNVGLRAFSTPGDGVLYQVPGYGPIRTAPARFGLEQHEAPLVQDASGRYEIDWELFEGAITERTKTFILCNPHNPVGRVFTREELEGMAERCIKNDLLIMSDEIHCDLLHAPNVHIPIASLSPEIEARTITLMAPSKTFNLPGLKAAIAIIPDPELRAKFVEARMGLVPTVNILGYTAALAAYRDCDDWLEAMLLYITANRDYISEFVAREMPGIKCYPSEGTYLAWLDCREAGIPGGDPFKFFLEEAKVGLSSGESFGTGADGFVRLNFACPRPLLEDGLNRMATALRAARAN